MSFCKLNGISLFVAMLALFPLTLFAANNTPIGYWKTVDDVTGEAKSIIHIERLSDQTLAGRVVKLFEHPDKRCVNCSGAEHDQPILGLAVMHGLKQDVKEPTLWSKGTILDPKNGHRYHCQIQMLNEGQVLSVRGYFGTPLFGRSQTWVRSKDPQ